MTAKVHELVQEIISTPHAGNLKGVHSQITAYINSKIDHDPLRFAALEEHEIEGLATNFMRETGNNPIWVWSCFADRPILNKDQRDWLDSKCDILKKIMRAKAVNKRGNNNRLYGTNTEPPRFPIHFIHTTPKPHTTSGDPKDMEAQAVPHLEDVTTTKARRDPNQKVLDALRAITEDEFCGVPQPYRRGLETRACRDLQALYNEVHRVTGNQTAWKKLWDSATPHLLNACLSAGALTTRAINTARFAFMEDQGQPPEHERSDFTGVHTHPAQLQAKDIVQEVGSELPCTDDRYDQVGRGIKRRLSSSAEELSSSRQLLLYGSDLEILDDVTANATRTAIVSVGTQTLPEKRIVSIGTFFDYSPIQPDPCVKCSVLMTNGHTQTEITPYEEQSAQTDEPSRQEDGTQTDVQDAEPEWTDEEEVTPSHEEAPLSPMDIATSEDNTPTIDIDYYEAQAHLSSGLVQAEKLNKQRAEASGRVEKLQLKQAKDHVEFTVRLLNLLANEGAVRLQLREEQD